MPGNYLNVPIRMNRGDALLGRDDSGGIMSTGFPGEIYVDSDGYLCVVPASSGQESDTNLKEFQFPKFYLKDPSGNNRWEINIRSSSVPGSMRLGRWWVTSTGLDSQQSELATIKGGKMSGTTLENCPINTSTITGASILNVSKFSLATGMYGTTLPTGTQENGTVFFLLQQ